MGKEFVLNHIHGHYASFEKAIAQWNPQEETLIVMGNVCDYGHNTFSVCNKLLQLDFFYPDKVKFLKGKHEIFFDKFLANPHLHYTEYLQMGGLATILSFYHEGVSYEETKDRHFILDSVLPYVDFSLLEYYINTALPYYETDDAIYLSEGISLFDVPDVFRNREPKTLYLSCEADSSFRPAYLDIYLTEEMARSSFDDCSSIVAAPTKFRLAENLFTAPAALIAYRIESGEVQDEIGFLAEE